MKLLEFWGKIPVALRWILLFPTYLFITCIIGFFVRITILDDGFPMPVFNLIFPPIMAVISLFILYHIAPAIKLILLVILITLRAFLIPLFVFGFYMHFQDVGIDISWDKWWSPFIGEILTLIASIWIYKYIKEETEPKRIAFQEADEEIPEIPKDKRIISKEAYEAAKKRLKQRLENNSE